jgi:hypothetical protein
MRSYSMRSYSIASGLAALMVRSVLAVKKLLLLVL